MEKLQSALNKARRARDGHAGPGDVGRMPQLAPKRAASSWDSMKEISIDPQRMIRNRIMTTTSSHDALHFDILRTKILLQMQQKQWTRLAITSPTPDCGKTTVAVNIALALKRQKDVRIILFDLDLRRPGLATIFGHTPEHELSKLLSGEISFEEQAVRVGDNLALAITQRKVKDPTQYLLSEQMAELLNDLEAVHQPTIMIFDLPPILVNDDTRALLKHMDCGVIVARAEHTTAAQITLCENEIAEQSHNMGVILNQCRHLSSVTAEYY